MRVYVALSNLEMHSFVEFVRSYEAGINCFLSCAALPLNFTTIQSLSVSLQVWQTSSQEKVKLTELWKEDERCVLVFARSMG